MTDEKRSDNRRVVNLPVRWDGSSGFHESRIEDISKWGCFVNTNAPVELGDVLSLEIKLPSGEWLELRGEVTSYQPGIGFGLRFPFLTEDEELALRDLDLLG